jgi:integrase
VLWAVALLPAAGLSRAGELRIAELFWATLSLPVSRRWHNGAASRPALRVVGEPAAPPRRQRNAERRPREYLTPAEVETLIRAAKQRGRYGHRDMTMILIAYRHGLRVGSGLSSSSRSRCVGTRRKGPNEIARSPAATKGSVILAVA